MSNILIDLGELPQRGQRRSLPIGTRRPIPYRFLLSVLAVVLLGLLGGAAYLPPPPAPTIIAALLADTTFISGDRLFVVSASPGPFMMARQNKIVSAYALPAGTLLSRTTVTAVTGAILDVTAVGDAVLVTYRVDAVGAEATVALAAGTDRVLWVHPARMLAALPHDGLALLHENMPSGTLQWYGIDVASGRIRWSLGQPAAGYTTVAVDRGGFPTGLVTASVDGHIEVRDAATGALTAKADVQAPPDWRTEGISIWAVDDMVLIGGRAGTTAYDLADLSRRWTNDVDLSQHYVLPHCEDAVCAVGSFDGVQVLDPATGRRRWAADHWSALEQVGRYLLADGPVGGPPVEPQAVVDPVTGAQLGDFGPWRSSGDPRPDGTVIGLWQAGQDVVWYASLDPATLAVRVLGSADRVSGDCRTTPDVLICRRLDSSVGIWRLG